MHTVKPLDETLLHDVFSRFSHIFTLEEHSILGGFGGSVAEWLSDQKGLQARLSRIGTQDKFMAEAGAQDHAREFFGISKEKIVERVLQKL
jgi:transketolase